MQISIAGFRFSFITENVKLHDYGTSHWVSSNFRLAHDRYEIFSEITVIITDQPAPDYSQFTKIFDSESSWTGYRHFDEYMIVEHHPQHDTPVVVSLFQPEQKSITVYCSERFVEQPSNTVILHPFSYPLDQVVMSFLLADSMGGVLHSTGWIYRGEALVFPGKSGAGKSTFSRLIKQVTGGKVLSDDRVAIRKQGERVLAYGTPWPGEEGDAINCACPLKGLFFLNQGESNSITRLNSSEAFRYLMPVMTIPWYDERRVKAMMAFADYLLESIPMYRFTFTRDSGAIDELLQFLGDK